MPVAITVKAVNETARPILSLWEQIGRFESRPSMRSLGYPPHITLAVYDDVARDVLGSVVEAVFAGTPALRVTFDGVRHFDGAPLVLWASPTPCAGLAQAHAAIHGRVDPSRCRAHYRPGAWVPHCTLGTEVLEARRQDALDFARRAVVSFDVVFDVADGVAFPPVEVIRGCALVPPSSG